MGELIKNAWIGWFEMSEAGKLVGLLLFVLIILALFSLIGLKRKRLWQVINDIGNLLCPRETEKGMILAVYAAVMLLLCICPVTAAFLMLYQTRFYDYYWVFAYVPVTLVLALGISAIIVLLWKKDVSKKGVLKAGAGTVMILFVIFLCGAGGGQEQDSTPMNDYKKTALLLERIKEEMGEEKICLWAPEETMASARRVSPDVTLIYGRNIWDRALDAYSFEQTMEWQEELHEWMLDANRLTEWQEDYAKYVEEAISHGVNVIVLSKESWQEIRDGLEACTEISPVEINDSFVYFIKERASHTVRR